MNDTDRIIIDSQLTCLFVEIKNTNVILSSAAACLSEQVGNWALQVLILQIGANLNISLADIVSKIANNSCLRDEIDLAASEIDRIGDRFWIHRAGVERC